MAVPGYRASVWAYRQDIRAEGTLSLGTIIALTAVGGIVGAILLVVTSPDAFIILVPWLLLTATILFATAPSLLKLSERRSINVRSPVVIGCILFVVMTYGGYFNGGLGIIMLVALSLQGYGSLHGINGLKNFLSSILALLSVVTFATADLIAWEAALPIALSNIRGAYVTAHFVRQFERTDLPRYGIIGIGLTITALLFLA